MARTIQDLMRVTGLGRDSVKKALRNGMLPGYKVGARYVIPDEAFEDFVHGRWSPKPVVMEAIRVLPQPDDLIKRRTG